MSNSEPPPTDRVSPRRPTGDAPTERRDADEPRRVESDELGELWERHRRRAVDVAYRLLGSIHDAEDVVQEAYARLAVTDVDAIDDVRGWLVTVTSRLCIDRRRAHEHRRRAYVGPWLPEPLVAVAAGEPDPADRVTLDDSVRMALLVVLEELSPAERTAFVLHDVFGLRFDEIAEIVGRSAPACRQLAARARRHIAADRAERRFDVDRDAHDAVVRRFADATERGDLDALVAVLDPDVVGDFDSGGLLPGAPLGALGGASSVAEQLNASIGGLSCRVVDVNGEPGVLVVAAGRAAAVISVEVHDGRVTVVHGIGNPDKLRHIRP